jgi:diaminopimelate decarboxylase
MAWELIILLHKIYYIYRNIYNIIKMPTQLNISDNNIINLCNTFGTPLQIYDGSLIIENQKNFIKARTILNDTIYFL